MSSSSDAPFDLLDLPLLPRKIVVENMKPAIIVALHSEPAIRECLPIYSPAIININCFDRSITIEDCSRKEFRSFFDYPIDKDSLVREAIQHNFRMENYPHEMNFDKFECSHFKYKIDAESMKKIWPSITLRDVFIRGEPSYIRSQLVAVTLVLSEIGLDKCESLRIWPMNHRKAIDGIDLNYLFKKLQFKKIEMRMDLLGLPPTIPPSADWNFFTSESLEQEDIERLMMTANSILTEIPFTLTMRRNYRISDLSCNAFCKKWLQDDCKIKWMTVEIGRNLYNPSNPTRRILEGIQNVRVENGWIIEREDGKKARINRSSSIFYLTALE